jgi:hypothetical protein
MAGPSIGASRQRGFQRLRFAREQEARRVDDQAQAVVKADHTPDKGRRAQLVRHGDIGGALDHPVDPVDHHAAQQSRQFEHDNLLGGLDREPWQAQPVAQVEHGDDAAPEVQHAEHDGTGAGQGQRLGAGDGAPHALERQADALAAALEFDQV